MRKNAILLVDFVNQERRKGGEQRSPMGQAVIGGVMTSGLLALVVAPVICTYLDDLAAWAKRFGKMDASPGNAAELRK